MSLRQLAKASKVNLATIVRLEAGGFDPRLSTLEKLAKALRVTVSALLGEGQSKKGG
jgi:transcriptional regulator with XRE-family HTH domain